MSSIRSSTMQKPIKNRDSFSACLSVRSKYLARKKIDPYIAMEKKQHGEKSDRCKRGPVPKRSTRVERMKRKLQTQAGAKVYSRRKTIAEPIFGQIKHARGFRQFLLRGIEKVRTEWALVCATHNILKMYRVCYG